jgi:hypothetical protein
MIADIILSGLPIGCIYTFVALAFPSYIRPHNVLSNKLDIYGYFLYDLTAYPFVIF